MTEADVRAFALRLIRRGTLDSTMLAEVCKTAFSQSLEAHGTHAGAVADRLAARGARTPETAVRREELAVYAPETGSPHDSVLVMERSGRVFALAVEWGNKPKPELEASLDRYYEQETGQPAEPRDHTPDRTEARYVRAYAPARRGELGKLVAEAVADKWRSDCMFSTSSSYESYQPGEGWVDGHVTLSASGIDSWREFFAALRTAFESEGDAERLAADAAEMGSRRWRGTGDEALEHFDAARELGRMLAAADGFLPGETCAMGLSTLGAVQAELEIDKLFGDGQLDRIHAACIAKGHLTPDTDFDFNDLDDHVYAAEKDGIRTLFFRDQNRRSVVEMRGDAVSGEILVRSAPAHTKEAPAPLARFAIADGKASAVKAPGLVGDDIRSWNSFVSVADSADCVLEEEYGAQPTP